MDLNGPALAPPPGVVPNLTNPPNNNPLAIGVLTACAAVATLCLLLRAYARVWLARKLQVEESMYFSLPANVVDINLVVQSVTDF